MQINKENVKHLSLAWVHKSGQERRDTSIQTNPVFGDGLLYITSPCCVIGLNGSNGSEIWRRELPTPVGRRGITYSSGYLFVPSGKGVYILEAKTGEIKTSFGRSGVFGKDISYLPPVISGSKLIVANFLGSIEAWDINNGKKLWKTSLVKDGVEPRLWSGLSYDEKII